MAAEVRRLAADSTQIAEAAVWEYECVSAAEAGWYVVMVVVVAPLTGPRNSGGLNDYVLWGTM